MLIAETKFNQVFPRAARGVYETIAQYIEQAGCKTKMQQAMFLAQCGHESRGFTAFTENLNYSADGLMRTFRKYFTPDTAVQYARKPENIANRVYANRMGNGSEQSGDGWLYRGRGIINVTGKRNHNDFAKWIGREIKPEELATNLTLAVKAGVWFWIVNDIASLSSVEKVTLRLNGGHNGLEDRINLYRRLMA